MSKGCNHHVMPYNSGWCVMSEANHRIIAHFDTQENAMAYASHCARGHEGSVLVHTTAVECAFTPSCESSPTLSTVALPQQDSLPDFAHQQNPTARAGSAQSWQTDGTNDNDFDPFLGFDESYFEI